VRRTVWQRISSALAAPAIALAVSLVVSALALLVSGHSPLTALRAMWNYVSTTDSLVTILNKSGPLYVVALSVAIGFKMNLFNIGADGQYRLGALMAAASASAFTLPRPLHIIVIMLIAIAAGAAWAAIPGVLKVTRNVNEVVSTIMLNFVATGLSAYLLATYFRNKRIVDGIETKLVPKSGLLPNLNGFFANFGVSFPRNTTLEGFLPIAILVGVALYLLIWRTRFGFDLRMTGASPAAARSSGVNASGMIVKTIMISGGLAGLAAMGFLLTSYPKYSDGFPLGLAFTGIAVALLGRNHPAGVAAAAFVWSGIEQASRGLSSVKIPTEISKILLGTLLISSVIAFEVVRRHSLTVAIKHAAASHPAPSPAGATS
jgi:ABC-type uncharacterized transport system permease subunit